MKIVPEYREFGNYWLIESNDGVRGDGGGIRAQAIKAGGISIQFFP